MLCDVWNVSMSLSKLSLALTRPPKRPAQLELVKASQ